MKAAGLRLEILPAETQEPPPLTAAERSEIGQAHCDIVKIMMDRALEYAAENGVTVEYRKQNGTAPIKSKRVIYRHED